MTRRYGDPEYRPCPVCDGQTGDVDDCEICEGTGWTTVRKVAP